MNSDTFRAFKEYFQKQDVRCEHEKNIKKLEEEIEFQKIFINEAISANAENLEKRLEYRQDLSKVRSKLIIAIEALESIAKTNSPKTSYEAKQALELITKEEK